MTIFEGEDRVGLTGSKVQIAAADRFFSLPDENVITAMEIRDHRSEK